MNYIIKVSFFLIILLFLVNTSLVYAQQESTLPAITIGPNMTYYPMKRLFEKLMEKLQFTNEAKEKYYEDLMQKRLAELEFVVDKSYLDQVEKSTQRVSYQAGVLTDYVVKEKLNNKKQSIDDLFKMDKTILEKLRDKYPVNSSFFRLIQDIINSLSLNLQKL